MNKKLIAVAVAAAFAAPMAASADATIYGSIHTSLQKVKTETAGVETSDNWDVIGNDGALGLKGSEDLGNGMKALYKIEMNFDGSGGSLATQAAANPAMTWDEVWVGLTGGWGTALIGREDSPYKTFMDSPGVDILGDSIVDVDTQLRSVGASGFQRFTANGAIAYVSPTFSGFTFSGAIVPGGQSPATPGGSTNVNGNSVQDGVADHYAIGANYKMGGLKVAAGYEKLVPVIGAPAPSVTPNDDQKTYGVGASYTFGAFFVGGKYEKTDSLAFANPSHEAKRGAVTGKFSFGNNAIGLTYTQEDIDYGAGSELEAKGYGIFGEHNLSNRTKVYVAYGDAEGDANAVAISSGDAVDQEAKGFALGVVHNF